MERKTSEFSWNSEVWKLVSRFFLYFKDHIDLFENFRRQLWSDFARFHILLQLLHAARTSDDRAHERILQTPCQRQLRKRATQFLGNWFQRLNLRNLIFVGGGFGHP